MRKSLLSLVVTLVMVISLPVSAMRRAPSVAELLPADSLGYAELPNMEVFYYLISEIGQAAIASLEEEAEVPEDIKVKGRAMLEAFNEITPLLPKSGSLGVVSIDPVGGQPSLLFVSELSEGLAPLASAATKLLAAAPNVQIRKSEYGTEVIIPHAPIPPIGVTVRENVLYAAVGEGLLERVLSEGPRATLASTAHFREVGGITGGSPIASAYLNLDAIREKLMPVLPPNAKQFVELLGLKDVHAAGVSVSADEKYVGFNAVIQYTSDAAGIASVLSFPNTKPKGIAYIPEDFSYVTRFSAGPPDELFGKIRAILEKAGVGEKVAEGLAQAKENAGIDLEKILASLGGEITFAMKVPETLAIPNMVMCVEARDPEYLMGLLKNLLAQEGAPATITETEVSGKKAMLITPNLPVPVTPVIVVDDDVMVIGMSSTALEKAFAAKANGQNIANKPSFKEAMRGLPASSNVALEYIQVSDLGPLALAGLGMAAMRAPEEAKPMVDKVMQYAAEAVRDLEAYVEVMYRTPSGLALQSRWGTRSVMQIVRNGAAFAAKAAMYFVVSRHVESAEREAAAEALTASEPAPEE